MPKLQGRRGLAVGGPRGLDQVREVGRCQGAVVRERFGLEDAAVDVIAERAEVAQVRQPPSDAEIVGIVEGGLGAQRALLLEVMLDVAALVGDVQTRIDAGGDDAGGEPAGRGPGDLARKEELDVIGPPEVEILADHAFKEFAAAERAIEHLGATDFELENRELIRPS